MTTVGFVGLVFRIWGASADALEGIVGAAGAVSSDPEGITVVSLAPCAPLDLVRYGAIVASLAPLAYDSRAIVMAGGPSTAAKAIKSIFQGSALLAQSQGATRCAIPPGTVRDMPEMGIISALTHVGMWDSAADALNLEIECSPAGLATAAVYGIATVYAARSARTLARAKLSDERSHLGNSVKMWIGKSQDGNRSVPGWIAILWNNGALTGRADRLPRSPVARGIKVLIPV